MTIEECMRLADAYFHFGRQKWKEDRRAALESGLRNLVAEVRAQALEEAANLVGREGQPGKWLTNAAVVRIKDAIRALKDRA